MVIEKSMSVVTPDFMALAIHEANGCLEKRAFLQTLLPLLPKLPQFVRDPVFSEVHYLVKRDGSSDHVVPAAYDVAQAMRVLNPALEPICQSPITNKRSVPQGLVFSEQVLELLVSTEAINRRQEFVWPKKADDPLIALTESLQQLWQNPRIWAHVQPAMPAQAAFCLVSARQPAATLKSKKPATLGL
jgi:hypothetical protein